MKTYYDYKKKRMIITNNDKYNFYPPKSNKIKLNNNKLFKLEFFLLSIYIIISLLVYFLLYFLNTIMNIDVTSLFPNYFFGIAYYVIIFLIQLIQVVYTWFSLKIMKVNCNKKQYYLFKTINYLVLLVTILINIYFFSLILIL